MPALNFQARFADAVEMGTKTQTIRRVAKRPVLVGDTLYLYTGMRTKACRKLREAKCIGVTPVEISTGRVVLNGVFYMNGEERLCFAQQDSFRDFGEMNEWFRNQYKTPTFYGVLIQWEPK